MGVPVAVPGGYTLVVGRDIEDQRQFADTMWQVALWSVGLLSALGIGAGLLISRSVLTRIETVSEASRKIMAGDLSRRIPLAGSGDELDRLAESLNAMLARIEELMAALREVSDNIAHDLKTPLTRLRNRAEAALRSHDDPAAYRDGLSKTIEEADELIRTFNSLLLIARLEAGAAAENMALVDPAAVIADVAELYEPVAEQAGLRLEVTTHDGLQILANRELISQAVANLVDNAIKYSADSKTGQLAVRIGLDRAGENVEITVADSGPASLRMIGRAPCSASCAWRRAARSRAAAWGSAWSRQWPGCTVAPSAWKTTRRASRPSLCCPRTAVPSRSPPSPLENRGLPAVGWASA